MRRLPCRPSLPEIGDGLTLLNLADEGLLKALCFLEQLGIMKLSCAAGSLGTISVQSSTLFVPLAST